MLQQIKKIIIFSAVLLASTGAKALDGAEAFAKLKAMAGIWQTSSKEEQYSAAKYEVIAQGSVVMETVGKMITMYHMDGEKLMATHYCEAKNQPRLIAVNEPNSNAIQFQFLDITNSKPEDPHIHAARFMFEGADKVLQHWVWYENGQEQGYDFEYTRKK